MDDEADTRTLIEEILESAGHEVVLAADGLEGLRQYHSTPVDLALVDLFMPNREGLETIKELKQQFPDFPIIAMSGDSMALPLLSVARRLGATEVLQKPFLPEELLEAIKHVLRPTHRRTAKKRLNQPVSRRALVALNPAMREKTDDVQQQSDVAPAYVLLVRNPPKR
jgi:CheY-like chemotaxis protein